MSALPQDGPRMGNLQRVTEGHLDLHSGIFFGFQRKFVVIDSLNGFLAFAPRKELLFLSSSSETIPGCVISDAEVNKADVGGAKTLTVTLVNGRKLLFRVHHPEKPEDWVERIFDLTIRAPYRPSIEPDRRTVASTTLSGATGNVIISWTTETAVNIVDKPDEYRRTQIPEVKPIPKGVEPSKKEFELLFVACDPAGLMNVMNMTQTEREIFGAQLNFTFHTQIVEVNTLKSREPGNLKGRVSPSIMSKMVGDLHAYRNESIKQYGEQGVSKLEGNAFITTYQILGPGKTMSDEDMTKRLLKNLSTFDWFPFKEFKLHESLHTKYFNHFSNADLARGLLWKLIDIQGDHRTMYISGSSCFESVLQIWQYQEMLFKIPKVLEALPKIKSAPIGIIGAGPAGLMMAVRLARLGYTCVELFESSDRFGGKSLTVVKETPLGKVVCELGTCYLSADYESFRNDFAEFMPDETPVPSTVDRQFVTEKELRVKQGLNKVEDFQTYAVAVGMEENDLKGFKNLTKADMLFDLYEYAKVHKSIFKGETPFPRHQPEELKGIFGKQTYYDFLKTNGFDSIIGILDYAYQAQGYGSMRTIPAFYGLVWITPPLLHALFLDCIRTTIEGHSYASDTITYMNQGWGSLWERVMRKYNFTIHYNAIITQVDRPFGM